MKVPKLFFLTGLVGRARIVLVRRLPGRAACAVRIAILRGPKMASFFGKSAVAEKASEKVERMRQVADYLPKDKESLLEADYDNAGLEYLSAEYGIGDSDADRYVAAMRRYCETHKRVGKDGKSYADLRLGRNSYRNRAALGALFGDGALGGHLYLLASAIDTRQRREWFRTILNETVPAGTVVKAKARKAGAK